jgi:hypothetical protein
MCVRDIFIAAISRSTYLQNTFKQLCGKLGIVHKNLVKRAPTRWGSLHDQLSTLISFQDVLLLMQAKGCFLKSTTVVRVPTHAETPILAELVERLRFLKVVGRLLEARNVFTLPHLPYLVYRLVDDCQKAIDNIDGDLTLPLIATIRRTMKERVLARLGKHLNDSSQPSLLCAMLLPEYSFRLSQFGVTYDTQRGIVRK